MSALWGRLTPSRAALACACLLSACTATLPGEPGDDPGELPGADASTDFPETPMADAGAPEPDAGTDAGTETGDPEPDPEPEPEPDPNCPISVVDGSPLCGPFVEPAVFFSPHQDDETLGMGGALREHVLAGRPVFVELMTNGDGSGVRGKLDDGGSHPWHDGSHVYSLTKAQFSMARDAEQLDALRRLGVTGVFRSGVPDGTLTVADVRTRIQWWIDNGGPGLSLKGTVSGDKARYSEYDAASHPDHNAVWDALMGSGFDDIRGYLVYQQDPGNRTGRFSGRKDLSNAGVCGAKRDALNAFKVWAPGSGRYAVGYHSVRTLFDGASDDCYEWIVVPD